MSRRKLDCTKIVFAACCTMEKTDITLHVKYRQGVLNVPEYNVLEHILPNTTSPESVFTVLLFWRRNPTKTLGFLLPWISPWFFVDFLLSPPPNAQLF